MPEDWKTAQVAPAFKKGDKCHAVNYRPISLTRVCCEIMEHIICHHVHEHLDDCNILSHLQHGFRSRHSCESQLITTLHDLLWHYDNKSQVDIAVLNFSKAFDTVPHRRLIPKLGHYGMNGKVGAWIAGFLQNRSQW